MWRRYVGSRPKWHAIVGAQNGEMSPNVGPTFGDLLPTCHPTRHRPQNWQQRHPTCATKFRSDHSHDLVKKDCQFSLFQKLLASNYANGLSSAIFATSHSHFCDLMVIIWPSSPIAFPSDLICINCNVVIRNLIPCLQHVNWIWVNRSVCIIYVVGTLKRKP